MDDQTALEVLGRLDALEANSVRLRSGDVIDDDPLSVDLAGTGEGLLALGVGEVTTANQVAVLQGTNQLLVLGEPQTTGSGGGGYTAGAGLTNSPPGVFNVGAGDGVTVGADTVGVDSTVMRTTAIGTTVQAFDATLSGLATLNATAGMVVQTAADTFTKRTLTGTANRLSITNGDGVSGAPTFDISASYIGQASITTLGTIGTGTWQGSVISATYIDSAVARLASPAFTGTPTAPTAADATSTTQIATTAFVKSVVGAKTYLPSSIAYEDEANTFTSAQTISNAGGKTTLALTSTGANTGLTIGADVTLYRSAANVLKTDDRLVVELTTASGAEAFRVSGSASTSFISMSDVSRVTQRRDDTGVVDFWTYRNAGIVSANQGIGLTFELGQGGTQQNAGYIRALAEGDYSVASARDSYLTFATALDGTNTEAMRLSAAGQMQLPVTGTAGGLLIGGDATLYRSSALVLATNSDLQMNGKLVRGLGPASTAGDAVRYEQFIVAGMNIVHDSSFETETLGTMWSGANGTLTSSTDNSRYGDRSGKLVASGATAAYAEQTVPGIVGGRTYSYTAYARGDASTTNNWYIEVQFLTAASATTGSATTSTPAALSTTWTRATSQGIAAPSDATQARLRIRFSTNTAGKIMYIDGVQLEEGDVPTGYAPKPDEIIDGAITTAKLAANSVVAAKIASGAVTTVKLDATAIDAMTITGATFRTSSGSSRTQMDSTGVFTTTDSGTTKDVLLSSSGLRLLTQSASFETRREVGWYESGTKRSYIGNWKTATNTGADWITSDTVGNVITTIEAQRIVSPDTAFSRLTMTAADAAPDWELAAIQETRVARVRGAIGGSFGSASNFVVVTVDGATQRKLLRGDGSSDYAFNDLSNITTAAWTSWTPTWTNVTIGNATVTAKYVQIGKLVIYKLWVKFGTTTTISGNPRFSLPVTGTLDSATANTPTIGYAACYRPSGVGVGHYSATVDMNSTAQGRILILDSSGTYLMRTSISSTIPFTWTTDDEIYAQGFYMAA